MRTRYEKPVDPDILRHRRQQLIANRVFRWTHAVAGDDEVVSIRRWWSFPELHQSLTVYGFGGGWCQPPALEQFYQEFLAALEAGAFDSKGKTRVALLDPTGSIEPSKLWPQLRLTFHRARQLLAASRSLTVPSLMPGSKLIGPISGY